GRLHRLHEGKREVRVYDYIDNSAAMLEKMYHKRLKGYAAIGYTVAAGQEAALDSDIIYDQNSFQERFLHDIAQAGETVVIVSPYVTVKRVKWIEAALAQCVQKRVKVTVVTRDPDTMPTSSRGAAQTAIRMLQGQRVKIVCQEGIHQKYAVIDGSVVWYGSVNLLSFGASKESIMRLVSGSIARALLAN
ncbi:MAG: helicase, partial [Clostridia bacterium]|nr:helicase [Clostridia bacterium]